MSPITYKFVLDMNGFLVGVELWQENEHITLSMAGLGTHKSGYRWLEIKEFLDNVQLPKYVSLEDKQTAETIREVHTLPPRQA